MTFDLTGWMCYAMWAVLGVIIIDCIVALVKTSLNFHRPILALLQNILYHVFPLYLIVNMTVIDPTGLILLILYYVCAVGVIIHYLYSIKAKL